MGRGRQGMEEGARTRGEPEGGSPEATPSGTTDAIDFARYLPTVLARLVGRLRASANDFFGRQYGLTLLEWRILSLLAADGPASAYAIWTEGDLDKAAVSRALRELRQRDLVVREPVSGHSRGKALVSLTARGHDLYARTFDEVIARHDRLLGGLSAAEVEAFLAVARHLEAHIPAMGDPAAIATSDFKPVKPPARPGVPARAGRGTRTAGHHPGRAGPASPSGGSIRAERRRRPADA